MQTLHVGPGTPSIADVMAELRRPGWRGSSLLRRYRAENPAQSRVLGRELRSVRWETRDDLEQRLVRFGFVGSAGTANLDGLLVLESLERGIVPSAYHAATRETARELCDPGSGLYAHRPDIVVVATSLPGEALSAGRSDPDRASIFVRALVDELLAFRSRSNAVLLVHSFVAPEFRPLGLGDWREKGGVLETFSRLNAILVQALRDIPDAHLIDLNQLVALSGVSWWTLHRSRFVADVAAEAALASCLCRDYAAFGAALRGFGRKCLVLDLDDTLWGGVVSEVGAEEVEIGGDYPGNVFRAIQDVARQLQSRGVILAINSRNFDTDAWRPFRCRPEMLLKPEHFSAWRINWNDKVANLKELAEELQLGLDSLVMLDNDPVEQAWVERHLPEVHVIPASDPLEMLHALATQRLFEGLGRTAEDTRRAGSYAAASKRRDEAGSAADRSAFLAGLDLTVKVGLGGPREVPRLAQLAQRANQFNMTTKRYSEAQIREFCADRHVRVLYCACSDRFSDEGIVGMAVLRDSGAEWVLDSFLLSCRVLGWGIERALIDGVICVAASVGATALRGEYLPTSRNGLAEGFYRDLGFTSVPSDAGGAAWSLALPVAERFVPEWVQLEIEESGS